MSTIDTIMLEAEREELLRRLTGGTLDNLGVIERSFERRALRERVKNIDDELAIAFEQWNDAYAFERMAQHAYADEGDE